MADEVVPAASDEVRLVEAVGAVGSPHQVVVLVGLGELVDQLDRHGGVHVVVHVAVHQEELALQLRHVGLVGFVGEVARARRRVGHQQSLVLLGPVDVVARVVVVAGARHGHLVEVRVLEHGVGGGESAARVAVDAHPLQVHERVAGGQLLDRRHVVGQSVVVEVAVVDIVKRLRAMRRAHVVQLDHDEAQLGQREVLAAGLERPRAHAADLRTGVDVVDHRVQARLVQVVGEVDQAVDVGCPVASLDREDLGRVPPHGLQLRHVGFFQGADRRASV